MINKILFYFTYLIKVNSFYINQKLKKITDISTYDFTYISTLSENELKNILFVKTSTNINHLNEYHNFDWLYIAKKFGGAAMISKSKNLINEWFCSKYKINSFVWSVEIISKRIINLLYHYDFYANSSNDADKKKFIKLIFKNYLILKLKLKYINKNNVDDILILKCILLFKLSFNIKYKKINEILKLNYYQNINIDSVHISMNPNIHANYIINLYEIKNILLYYNQKIQNPIDYEITNLISVLKNFFHLDGTVALFNGSNNSLRSKVLKLCNNFADLKIKDLANIKQGIAIYNNKFIKIFFDVAKQNTSLIDKGLHAGTLAIEISCHNEKIITNCGSILKTIKNKSDYLRYSAAHSTIIINNTNISELDEIKSYKRVPENTSISYNNTDHGIVWEASHDGYKKNYKKIIKRKLKISNKKFRVEGKDSIMALNLNKKNIFFNIRFHLTTNCIANISRDKKSIFIKTKLSNLFIFKSDERLSIEESISVIGVKSIERTSQIVISGQTNLHKKNISWSLEQF